MRNLKAKKFSRGSADARPRKKFASSFQVSGSKITGRVALETVDVAIVTKCRYQGKVALVPRDVFQKIQVVKLPVGICTNIQGCFRRKSTSRKSSSTHGTLYRAPQKKIHQNPHQNRRTQTGAQQGKFEKIFTAERVTFPKQMQCASPREELLRY